MEKLLDCFGHPATDVSEDIGRLLTDSITTLCGTIAMKVKSDHLPSVYEATVGAWALTAVNVR